MSADFVLHVLLDDMDVEDFKIFTSNVLGGPWFEYPWFEYVPYEKRNERFMELANKFGHRPQCWVGEVSWLKASLLQDGETYIPDIVGNVAELVDNLPVITDELIAQIKAAAMTAGNRTSYKVIDGSDELIDFLKKYKGHRVGGISW